MVDINRFMTKKVDGRRNNGGKSTGKGEDAQLVRGPKVLLDAMRARAKYRMMTVAEAWRAAASAWLGLALLLMGCGVEAVVPPMAADGGADCAPVEVSLEYCIGDCNEVACTIGLLSMTNFEVDEMASRGCDVRMVRGVHIVACDLPPPTVGREKCGWTAPLPTGRCP